LPIEDIPAEAVPMAIPVAELPAPAEGSVADAEPVTLEEDGSPVGPAEAAERTSAAERVAEARAPSSGKGEAPTTVILEGLPAPLVCPVCQSVQSGGESCSDCGYYFSAGDRAGMAGAAQADFLSGERVKDRYELRERINE